jgi:enolase
MAAETYQALKATLKAKWYATAVGDEGGFAPHLRSNVEAVEVILAAIDSAGLRAGDDIVLALDPAASEFFANGKYIFRKSDGSERTPVEMVAYWEDWIRQYPILSIEDGVAENDDAGWRLMTDQPTN